MGDWGEKDQRQCSRNITIAQTKILGYEPDLHQGRDPWSGTIRGATTEGFNDMERGEGVHASTSVHCTCGERISTYSEPRGSILMDGMADSLPDLFTETFFGNHKIHESGGRWRGGLGGR